ncbi:MAG TPA: dethiobiotin synthase [Caulobacteraceae bacterium]|jgi:dethiobiotin synthetase
MAAVFITGTGTDVGKTYVAAALVRALVSRGVAVDVLKPVASGFDPAAPQGSDPWMLIEALGRTPTMAEIERVAPFRFRAPLSPPLAAQMEGRALIADAVIDLCRTRMRETSGVLIIEGAGGVMSPVDDHATFLDVIAALRVPALLVAGSYLGTISHTLSALEVLRARGVEVLEVAVSESEDSPSLDPTCEAIEAFGGVRVSRILRRGGYDAGDLIGRL